MKQRTWWEEQALVPVLNMEPLAAQQAQAAADEAFALQCRRFAEIADLFFRLEHALSELRWDPEGHGAYDLSPLDMHPSGYAFPYLYEALHFLSAVPGAGWAIRRLRVLERWIFAAVPAQTLARAYAELFRRRSDAPGADDGTGICPVPLEPDALPVAGVALSKEARRKYLVERLTAALDEAEALQNALRDLCVDEFGWMRERRLSWAICRVPMRADLRQPPPGLPAWKRCWLRALAVWFARGQCPKVGVRAVVRHWVNALETELAYAARGVAQHERHTMAATIELLTFRMGRYADKPRRRSGQE